MMVTILGIFIIIDVLALKTTNRAYYIYLYCTIAGTAFNLVASLFNFFYTFNNNMRNNINFLELAQLSSHVVPTEEIANKDDIKDLKNCVS